MGGPADILSAPTDIADAGRAASRIADGVLDADVAGPLRAVAAALPGSSTAAAGGDLAVRWKVRLVAVADEFTAQGDALAACAEAYRVTEQQLVEALQTPGRTPPWGPGPG